ncbi:lysine-arginine-ornithine-binding protein [Faunimonas pinastri]|uniref:Lysine-arginine-ornithine-binding protein n=1 Tax=Faunimonas pinastri TaxID=1855383 RepID=A0A1H9AKC4_9HYPH|nr:transporter substrate-binding domain-containing protein [Faunimonas pinastri]SEP77109.1 lysine-arginine-ornithine-binding protein [Faunimonas pinastri]
MRKTGMFSALVAGMLALAASMGTAEAKDWTHVNIGIEGAFPPWNMIDSDGKLAGYDVDLINDLCKRAEIKCDLIAGEWTSLIPSLNAGKFDMVMSVGINEARKKVVDFTVPYASGAATFIVAKDGTVADMPMANERLNLNDHAKADPVMADMAKILKGKTVGVVGSSSHEQLMHAYFGNDVDVRTYKGSADRDLDIAAGRIDAGFDSGVYAASMLGKPGSEDLKATGPLIKGAMLATDVAIALRKGEPDLKAKFDAAIKAAAADGTIRKLSVKWSKLDLTPEFGPEQATK